MNLKLACIADEQRARGLFGGQKVKPFNNSGIDEIPQQPLTETNHSTVQPFNHSTDNSYTSKKAFTLAEVLITLAVVGVVAAMTLPVLSRMYQKMVVKNQIKQAYNLISNAVNRVVMDDDFPHGCYYGIGGISQKRSECKEFFDAVVSKLETTKVCENNSFANGCVPDYKAKDFPNTSNCDGFKVSRIKDNAKAALLKNGFIIFSYRSYNETFPIIAFDINGFKGPNKPGFDVYAIQLSAKQQNYPIYGLSNNNSEISIRACLSIPNSPLFTNLSQILK